MELPIKIKPRYLNPGSSNAEFPNCMGMTYFHGQQIIAYGSSHLVVVVSISLNVISALDGHDSDSVVVSVAWAPYSGRLSSSSSKKDIIIWEPKDGGWVKTQVIILDSVANCMSWSISDHKFCIASDVFSIYQRKNINRKSTIYGEIFSTNSKLSFCSFSRDSRFILTLTDSNQEVFIWYKSAMEKNQYRRIPLFHPSKVKNMQWRTSDQIHDRCSFITLAEDNVVRIWAETGVNETLAFNVVIALPSDNNIISAAFVTTSSRMIKSTTTNDDETKHISVDNYAFGHGHMPTTNVDYREANIASLQEINMNISRLLTCDTNNNLCLWKLSGISTAVRRTPKIELIETISCNTKISPGEANKMFAVCRFENNFNEFENKTKNKPELSLSLILQNQKTNMIENIDVSLGKEQNIQVVGRTQGHRNKITLIRIHQKEPFMVTIDSSGVTLVWKYDDTDVYDPTVLTKFGCQIEKNIIVADWNGKERQLVAFEGTKFFLFDIPSDPSPSCYETNQCESSIDILDSDGNLKENPLDYRYCTTISDTSLFIFMTDSSIYVLSVKTKPFTVQVIKKFDKSSHADRFVYGAQAYISTLFPLAGATIYFYALANGEIHTIILDSTEPFKVHEETVLTIKDEQIVGIDYAHPGFLFVVTESNIYVAWRKSSQSINFEEIQKIEIDYKPVNVVCIATGLLTVLSSDAIHMYHARRDKVNYPNTYSRWEHVAACQMKNINAIEWSLDGILIVAQGAKISAFTKFMNTFFRETSHFKPPTIHHTFASLARAPSDYNPMNIYPIAASGRIHLLLDMFKFLLETFDIPETLGMYTKRLLNMPKEEQDKMIPIEEINEVTQPLIMKLKEKNVHDLTTKQSKQLIHLLQHFNDLQDPMIKALEPRAQVVARAAILEETTPLPFDLIILGWQVYSQQQLIKVMKFETWEDVEKSGIIFWCRDLDDMFSVLTPIAVSCFDEKRFLSIILLTLGRKNKILQRLFSKAGDDTRAAFFVRDFKRPKEKKFAERNAYSALSKHDFHISAAMFFLAGQIESVVRVLLKNLGSYSLAFLACRCIDNGYGKNTKQAIDEVFLEQARTNKDLAAVEFFNRIIDPNDPIELAPRMTQHIPGFFYPESALYGDMRFNVCETANTTISMKSDYIKSALYMGNQILTTLYLPYFSNTIVPPLEVTKLPIHHSGVTGSNKVNASQSLAPIYENDEEFDNEPIKSSYSMIIKKPKKEEEEDTEDDSVDNIFGGSAFANTVIDYSDYSYDGDYSSSSTSDDEEANNMLIKRNSFISMPLKDAVSRDLLESTRVDDWFNVIILFNICRYRLEYFLETLYRELAPDSPDIFMIIPEIEKVGPQTRSMKEQLHDYLIRSCKRRCFIYRRMLLMPTDEERQRYVLELCRNISLIPDQMLSFHISAQQITQLTATARILIKYTNGRLDTFEKSEFIVAAICTALFIYAFYFQDSKMMISLMSLDLTNIKAFPQELVDSIQVINCKPLEVFYHHEKVEEKGSFFTFILAQDKVRIYVDSEEDFEDEEALKNFTIALIDLMLFKTFVKNISQITINTEEFTRMQQFLNKLSVIYVQIFQYAVLVTPQITKLSELSNIRFVDNDSLNELYQFLIRKDDRETKIPEFCRSLYSMYSEAAPTKSKGVYIKPYFKGKYKLPKIKADVNGFAVNKDATAIFTISPQGIMAYSTDNKEEKDAEHNIDKICNINSPKVNEVYKSDSISSFVFTGINEADKKNLNEPLAILSHPTEDFAIVGDKKGQVWGFSYKNYEDRFIFNSPVNTPCSSLAVSYDGGMLAAAHGHTVSLYSFYLTERFKPTSRYDVWGERITCLNFLKGSGLFACGQVPSCECKSCITFWDALLPNKCAMIASAKFGKGIYSTSMDFSMPYNTLVVGCSNGSISMIDTRMFQIVATWKPHTKPVTSIKVRSKSPYFVSGSLDGSVMLWDIRNNDQLLVWEPPKNAECIGVEVNEKTVFSLYNDGNINYYKINV